MSSTLEAASSCASSVSSMAARSLLSGDESATSSVESAPDLSPQPLPATATLPPLDPAMKASTVRLPFQLPIPPTAFDEVDLASLVLDDEIGDAPIGFAVGKLRQLGSSLLSSTSSTCLHIPSGPTTGPYLRCSFPPTRGPVPSVYLPSHVVAIRSSDSPRTLLLPVHGLLWAAASPLLSFLSSRPEKQPPHRSLPTTSRPPTVFEGETTIEALPVVELRLPSSAAFPLLQGWVYLRSPPVLLSALLPPPPKEHEPAVTSSSSIARLLNPAPSEKTATVPPTPESLTVALSTLPSATLLRHIQLVHGLWQDAVALQVGDDHLWQAMGLAWRILVAALGKRDQQRRASTEAAS